MKPWNIAIALLAVGLSSSIGTAVIMNKTAITTVTTRTSENTDHIERNTAVLTSLEKKVQNLGNAITLLSTKLDEVVTNERTHSAKRRR